MAITYTWAVTGMKVTRAGTLQNYVVQTYWTRTGTDENGISGTFVGATPFAPDPTQPNFTPYDQLTQAIVLGWIQATVTPVFEDHMVGVIAKQIADKIDPVVDEPLPWAPAPTPPAPAPV